MAEKTLRNYEYNEICLGDESKHIFLRNILNALGFKYSGPSSLFGLSGLEHKFDAIGKRDRNILLVSGGAEYFGYVNGRAKILNPRERMEIWRNKALLSAYDVHGVLEKENFIIDLMFFQNVNNKHRCLGRDIDTEEWKKQHKLPEDIAAMRTQSVHNVPILPQNELANVATSIGASFLSLNDLTLKAISTLASDCEIVDLESIAKKTCRELRLLQHFNPPTDELLISAYDLYRSSDVELAKLIYDTSLALGHIPTENEIVPFANYKDPVETAKQLEQNRYIEFESTMEITEKGRKITQTIRKTAQGSFVIRVLKTLGLPELAKAVIQAFKND